MLEFIKISNKEDHRGEMIVTVVQKSKKEKTVTVVQKVK